jgi:hypothetical protein
MSDLNVMRDAFPFLQAKPLPPAPAPAIPDPSAVLAPVPTPKKANVTPDVMAQVQAMVWGGNPAVKPEKVKSDIGQAPAMNKSEGWGKV